MILGFSNNIFSRSYLSHANEEHNKLNVLPVPVGLSRRAFSLLIKA